MDTDLFVRLLIFDIVIAFVVAKLEIQIEGKYGWAENLPTWRVKNRFTKLIWGEQAYTGYHFWFLLTTLGFLHFPFFVFPVWSISLELILLASYLIAVILEDFFWFILNPAYGIKKFTKIHAHWHDKWIWLFPQLYITLGSISVVLVYLSGLV